MKVFGWSSFKGIKNIIFSVTVAFACLLNLEVYADKNVEMGAFDLSSGIKKIYRNKQSTKYKITALYDIYKITDYNGNKIIPEQIDGKNVLFSISGDRVTKVKIYSTNSKYEEVDLESASVIEDVAPPQILWKYKDDNNNVVWFEVQDEAGLYEIRSKKKGQSLRTVFSKMQQNAVVSIEAQDIDDLVISDVFGNIRSIDCSDITLIVFKALRNANGDRVMLKVKDFEKTITDLEYIDGMPIEQVSTNGIENIYNVEPGTTKIKVKFGEEYAIIQLDSDVKSPEVVRAWRKDDGSRILLEAIDSESGVGKMSYYSKGTKEEDVFKEFPNNDGGKVATYDISEGVTHLYVYDGLGNRTRLAINSIAIDDERQFVKMKYKNGQYKVIVKKEKSGVDEVKIDGVDIDTYVGYPVGEFTYLYNDNELDGDSHLTACDGVGNTMNLTVNEMVSIRKRMYKNSEGNIISIAVEDDRGIKKITDQDGNIVERFWLNEREVNGLYKVRDNTDSINVFYGDDKSYNIKLQELVVAPQVSKEVYYNELITQCVVASKAGIRKIEYKDGRKIVFKKDMPDDITVNCTRLDNNVVIPTVVTVYDALGNSVKINKELEA